MTQKPDHTWVMSCDSGTRATFTCPAEMSDDAAEHVIDSLRLILRQLERRLANSKASSSESGEST